jgi:hypothetical protein
MGKKRSAYRILLGKPQGKRTLGRHSREYEDNIEMDVREIGWGGMEWIHLARNRDQLCGLVNTVINPRIP